MTLRVVVADDEELGRERLARMLKADPEVELVGVCSGGQEALETIRALEPDVAFLDVQMPGLDAFALMAALPERGGPAFVLVTAHEDYALKAFERNAVDYVLKPFSHARVRSALARARERLAARSGSGLQQVLSALRDLEHKVEHTAGRIAVRTDGSTFFLKVESVDWVEAAGKYLHLHVGKHIHTIRGTMAGLQETLDPADFVRVSRSAIVNVDRIQEIQPWFQGAHLLILRDRTQLTSTRRYRRNLRRLLGK
ncbi:MAG TPA: LytTR family DNA-binding domain-containing protein [Gemmatimonadales bacterium]